MNLKKIFKFISALIFFCISCTNTPSFNLKDGVLYQNEKGLTILAKSDSIFGFSNEVSNETSCSFYFVGLKNGINKYSLDINPSTIVSGIFGYNTYDNNFAAELIVKNDSIIFIQFLKLPSACGKTTPFEISDKKYEIYFSLKKSQYKVSHIAVDDSIYQTNRFNKFSRFYFCENIFLDSLDTYYRVFEIANTNDEFLEKAGVIGREFTIKDTIQNKTIAKSKLKFIW
jgi:hypothetical protein